MLMYIFGQEIDMKQKTCGLNGAPSQDAEPSINMYVRMTNACQAKCKFCEFAKRTPEKFDFYKLYFIINELRKSRVKINRISFTGGEPTIMIDELNYCLKHIKLTDSEIFTIVNSNGLKIDADLNWGFIDSLSLSRHTHIENDRHDIFGRKDIINDDFLNALPFEFKKKIHISANLIKGYLDNTDKIYEFINHYSALGFHDFGFVNLMKVNKYCEDNFIDFANINFANMKNTIRNKAYNYKDGVCRCDNYLTFTEDGEINKSYARYFCDHTNKDSILVYDVDTLKNGFNGPVML